MVGMGQNLSDLRRNWLYEGGNGRAMVGLRRLWWEWVGPGWPMVSIGEPIVAIGSNVSL